MKYMLDNVWTFIKDILAPKKCYSCKKEWHFLCNNCFKKQNNFEWFCYLCKKESKEFKIHKKCLIENRLLRGKNFNNQKLYFDKIIVLTHYRNPTIKKLITYFKFYWRKSIGSELWKRLWKQAQNNISIKSKENTIIIPVPMFFIRKFLRGYNQSAIIAKSIAKYNWISYNTNVLIRRRHTRQQANLSQEKRVNNLQNAFKINRKLLDKIDKKTVLLVDDVVSTGTTLNEISKILKQKGAKKVIGVALASD